MADITLVLKANGPVFLHGAEPRGATEWRAPSVRGQLRYWLRAIEGARLGGDVPAVWQAESAVFGSTGRGSAVAVRCHPVTTAGSSIPAGTSLTMSMLTRPGVPLPSQALDALTIWLLLGGIGRNADRTDGRVQITTECLENLRKGEKNPLAGTWLEHPISNCGQLISGAQRHFARLRATNVEPIENPPPSFPILHQDYCWILIGQKPLTFNPGAAGYRKWLLNTFDRSTVSYLKARIRRNSSPISAQYYEIGNSRYPVFTVTHTAPDGPNERATLKTFADKVKSGFDAVNVCEGTP